MTQETSGTESAVETPKNDHVVVSYDDSVEAPAKAEPKNDPVEDETGEEGQDLEDTSDNDAGKKPRRGGFQKKIERKDREIADLNERIARLEGAGQSSKPAPSAKSDDATDPKPDPETFQGSTAEWIEALADWKDRQKEKTREAKAKEDRTKQAQQAVADKFQGGIKEFMKSHPDYEDVADQAGQVNNAVRDAILETGESGAEIVYYLATHPEELDKIRDIANPLAASRAIGRIEAKLEKSGDDVVVKTTNAPPPITPVKPRSSGGQKDPDKMSPEEYRAWREKGRGGR